MSRLQSRDCELRDARTAHPDRAVGLESYVSHNRLPLAVQEHGSFVWGSSDEGWNPEMFFPFPFERERRRRSDSRSRSRDRRRRRERRRSRSPRTPRREEAVPAKAVALPPLPPPTTPYDAGTGLHVAAGAHPWSCLGTSPGLPGFIACLAGPFEVAAATCGYI